ncbi:sulfurtransferase [Verticiella sediminum]|uniref:Sulfurtransferase n=1 Tax=Verticiella sediminum TaxID=1247510 RepID=A0A556B166_9BURK|nr:sulfurtransferase [Verticiella sediminum]TSH98937.1 sulfurtransferase [Verticiella sediminum]
MTFPNWIRLGAASVALAAAATAQASPLVSTQWLEQNLQNPQVRVLEVSVDPGVYERGHIPGAANLNWHTDLVDTVNRDIASRDKLQALLRAAGVSEDTTTVLYGDNNNWFAAWGAWVLDVYGVDNVKLLDGGRKKWEAEGLPLATTPGAASAGNVTLKPANEALRARLDEVAQAARAPGSVAIVDIRSPDEYSGKSFAPAGVPELSVRAGHVPGAVNVPWGSLVAADGTFKPVDELRAIYARVGVDGSKPVITYCRIGERSSHSWFALKKLLGYDVRNYDGSWTEYGNTVGVPIENPAGTVWGRT